MRTLVRIEISGLLGQFEHVIKFPTDLSFVVLHGPNGVGKTKLLELINAVFGRNLAAILETPFESVHFLFSDRSKLEIFRQARQPTDEGSETEPLDPIFSIVGTSNTGERQQWRPEVSEQDIPPAQMRRIIEREFGFIYLGAGRYRTPGGQALTPREIVNEYGRIPGFSRIAAGRYYSELPQWLDSFLADTPVHLIETQRLVQFAGRSRSSADEGRHRKSTVTEFSEDLARQIADVLATNSRTSQQLDRTFPRRVLLTPPPGPEVTDDSLRATYRQQSELREALEEVAILDNEEELPLPDTTLEEWQRRVLSIYLQDTQKKLATFQWILDRTRLLREIVNSKFINKTLVIDRSRGFIFETDTGREIDPAQLSSGEQHELVLVYDLLFNVPEGSLVLIDEPEISLHVKWQQQFLYDIERIATLSNVRFIIATHSPQVVHKWWDRTVALGPVEEG